MSSHASFDIRNLSFKSLAIILVLVLIPIVVLLRLRQTAVSVSAAWFNDSWAYRQAINVYSHTSAESNVYLTTTINISTTTHALSNDTDFRFTTATGQLLSYFIASGVGTTAITFHIQLPSFPSGAQTFYAYYGNPSASNGSSLADFSTPASNYTIGSYGTEELGGGPVAYWKFDEGVGTTIHDSTNNRNDAVVQDLGTTVTESNYYLRFPAYGTWVKIHDSIVANSDVATSYPADTPTYTRGIDYEINYTTGEMRILSGGAMIPSAGYYLDNIYTNSGPKWASENQCISGKCLYFDGADDSLRNLSNTRFSMGPGKSITFQTWVNRVSYNQPDYSTYFGLISLNFFNPRIYIEGNKKVSFQLQFTNGSVYTLTSITAIPDSTWSLVSGTWDGKNLKVYINGKLDATSPDYSGYTVTTRSDYLYLARIQSGASKGLMKGYLDETKVYPYARTLAQIQQDYTAGKAHAAAAEGVNANLGSNAKNADALSNGLVGYWKFDENIGTSTADSSGNSNTATFAAGTSAPSWGTGKYGVGLSFAGANYATGTTQSLNIPGSVTQSAWVNMSALPTTEATIIRIDQLTNISLRINSSGKLDHNYYGSSTWSTVTDNGSLTIPIGQWTFITIVRDTIANKIYFYYNGQLSSAQVLPQTPTTSPSGLLTIGGISGTTNFSGLLDDVRLYNRALSPAEVSQLYNYAPGPVAYWKFDEGTGTTAFDSSGNGLNAGWQGTLGNQWANGKYGKTGNFNGSNNYVQVSNTEILNSQLAYGLTISAWVKPNLFTTNSYETIVAKSTTHDAGGCGHQYGFVGMYTTAQIRFFLDTTGGALCQGPVSTGYLTTNQWSYITGTYDSLTGKAYIYINGKLDNSATLSGPIDTDSSTVLKMGKINDVFNGQIDEVKIYNYARTQKQIVEDMNGGNPSVTNKSMLGYWKFDEGTGSIANNSGNGGIGLTGALLGLGGSKPSWTDGKFGKAVSGDKNVYVRVNDANNAFDSATFSISTWVNVGTTNATETLFFARENYNTSGFRLGIGSGASSAYKAQFWTTESGGNINLTSSKALNDGTWHHLVFLYDGTMASIYTDGTKTGSVAGTYVIPTTYPFIIKGMSTSYIGANASMDEVKYYNYALTDQEVTLDYNRGVASQMGSLSSGSGNTAPATAASQEYCLPGDTAVCSPPVARWDFEEGSGTTAFDTSGNSNNAGIIGANWINSKSGLGKALSFNGTNQYLNSTDFDSNQITISSWSYFTRSDPGVYSYNPIITKDNASPNRSISMHYSWQSDVLYLSCQISTDGSNAIAAVWTIGSDPSPVLNQWKYITCTYDGNYGRLYVDNQLKATSTQSTGSLFNNSTVWTIGSRQAFSIGYFQGKIDQVRLYNYARTPAQIAWDYNKGGPIGWWKLDECQGGIVYDSSGVGNTGAINIGASGTQTSLGTCSVGTSAAWTAGATGKINSSLNFDGIDDYVQVNLGTTLTQGSFSFWLKPSINTGSNRRIISKSWGNDEIYISGSDSKLKTTGSLVTGDDIISTSAIPTNQWIHVVLTADTAGSKLYLNGVLNDTGSAASFSISSLRIGGQYTASWESFAGQLDDVRIYNYALTSEQIKQVYNGGAASFK